jgi:flagellar protein FliS
MMQSNAYLASRVLAADPLELVRILYEHALHSVADARHGLSCGDIAARSKAISRAIAILSELEASLNHEVGGSLSQKLAGLYRYMRERLLAANLHQEDAPLAEVESLLGTLAEAWNSIQPANTSAPDLTRGLNQFPAEMEAGTSAHAWSA